jgi:4-amino-4-deoxy-L-arabinose transferase-like glycosyltransferase
MQSILKNKKLLLILLIGFVLRLGFFLQNAPWQKEVEKNQVLINDATGYHRLAQKILFEQSFQEDMFRTPGYPAIVAAIYGIFGVHPWIVLLIQVFVSTLTLLLFFKIALFYFNERAALWATLFFATSSIYILHTDLLYT